MHLAPAEPGEPHGWRRGLGIGFCFGFGTARDFKRCKPLGTALAMAGQVDRVRRHGAHQRPMHEEVLGAIESRPETVTPPAA